MKDSSHNIQPPRLPLRALRWFCSPELLEDVEGDLNELFRARAVVEPVGPAPMMSTSVSYAICLLRDAAAFARG